MTDPMIRCRPLKPCPHQDRCARFLRVIPFGGTAMDFSRGEHGCNGRFIPVFTAPAGAARTHDHPGGNL